MRPDRGVSGTTFPGTPIVCGGILFAIQRLSCARVGPSQGFSHSLFAHPGASKFFTFLLSVPVGTGQCGNKRLVVESISRKSATRREKESERGLTAPMVEGYKGAPMGNTACKTTCPGIVADRCIENGCHRHGQPLRRQFLQDLLHKPVVDRDGRPVGALLDLSAEPSTTDTPAVRQEPGHPASPAPPHGPPNTTARRSSSRGRRSPRWNRGSFAFARHAGPWRTALATDEVLLRKAHHGPADRRLPRTQVAAGERHRHGPLRRDALPVGHGPPA